MLVTIHYKKVNGVCLRVEDPVRGVAVGLVGLLSSFMPGILDLDNEAVLVLLGTLLDLLASGGQVVGELVEVPVVVGLSNVVLPVLLHEIGQVLAVGRSRVGHVVVGEPALKLSLMPFVVSCAASPLVRMCLTCDGAAFDTVRLDNAGVFCTRSSKRPWPERENLPALPESQSAVTVWVAKATVAREARENFMVELSQRYGDACVMIALIAG